MPELSIIIPVYNVEKYICQCIKSVLNQTVMDYEIILVDDGSTDRCGVICEQFAVEEDRIIVVHQRNKGVSEARNAAMSIASGNYISFVDSDDMIHPQMYEILLQYIKRYSLDIINCGIGRDIEVLTQYYDNTDSTQYRILDSNDLLYDLFSRPSVFRANTVNKLYRKEILLECKFIPDMPIWEDLQFLMQVYVKNKSIRAQMIPLVLYYYRQNENSVTSSGNQYLTFRREQFSAYIYKYLKVFSPDYCALALDFFLDSSVVLLHQIKKSDLNQRIKILRTLDIKTYIMYCIIRAFFTRELAKERRHRFFAEGILGR